MLQFQRQDNQRNALEGMREFLVLSRPQSVVVYVYDVEEEHVVLGPFSEHTVRDFELNADAIDALSNVASGRFAVLAADTDAQIVSLLDSTDEMGAVGAILTSVVAALLAKLGETSGTAYATATMASNCFEDDMCCDGKRRQMARNPKTGQFMKACENTDGVVHGDSIFHLGGLSKWI